LGNKNQTPPVSKAPETGSVDDSWDDLVFSALGERPHPEEELPNDIFDRATAVPDSPPEEEVPEGPKRIKTAPELSVDRMLARVEAGKDISPANVLTRRRTQDEGKAIGPRQIAGYLPDGRGDVLISSSHAGWQEFATPVAVRAFSREESVALLRSRRPDLPAAAADRIAAALADLPVAVGPAAAFLADTELDADAFCSLLPDGALLVNAGRGPTIEAGALVEELRAGRIRAALDVTDPEPLPADHPLWDFKNVIITTHQGGFCDTYVDLAMPILEHNMRCFLNGLKGMVNVARPAT